MVLRSLVKRLVPGVSWQSPFINTVFRALDPLDAAVRRVRGLGELPRYSIRVRSNGVTKQFGGKRFAAYGELLASLLKDHAGMSPQSRVLEIGCGCGRTAYALARYLDHGRYVGMDIERVSLESCARSRVLTEKGFRFDAMDVRNAEYNPEGRYSAKDYRFPYDDGAFDVVFLVSVFTHMLTDDVKNYIAEISRLLAPGGVCMLTVFLMDRGREWPSMSFPFSAEQHFFYKESLPEVAVGYRSNLFLDEFGRCGLMLSGQPHWGSWRGDPSIQSVSGFSQDILFFSK